MWKLWGGCEGCVKSAIFAKSPTSLSSFSIAAPLPPRLLTREHVARFLEETWRSEFPVLYSIYLKQGGGVIILDILEETSGGALHSSTFCCCVREIIPFHKLFLVFFLSRISAEERRSGYEDVNFGCGHGNFMIGRSFVDTVSGLKITCNSEDQPEYPLSKSCPSRWGQFELETASWGTGNLEQGTGDREWGQGTGDREPGTGNLGQ